MRRRIANQEMPGTEFRHFTGRESELAAFQRCLRLPEGSSVPVLMFYGVGGVGKTWLLQRLRESIAGARPIPSAFLDLDTNSAEGKRLHHDPGYALAEIRFQLDVECPRFDLAYAMMRFKQRAGDEPEFKNLGKASVAWDFVNEGAEAVLSSIPGINVLTWLLRMGGAFASSKIKKTELGKWLLSASGNEDYIHLRKQSADDIHRLLADRLGQDLEAQLPEREDSACQAVVFIDTFEALRSGIHSAAQQHQNEEWVREIARNLNNVLLVIAGCHRLTWDTWDSDWSDPHNLVQHLIGGLSRSDAEQFLQRCGLGEGALRQAVLRACVEGANAQRDGAASAYHPFSLGLCANAIANERAAGREPDPASFAMASGDYDAIAMRFLKSLQSDDQRHWIAQLAQTPRFDEAAARAAFSPVPGAAQDTAWNKLCEFVFLQGPNEGGWYTLNAQMRNTLRQRLLNRAEERLRAHVSWRDHWQSRSQEEADEFAALAWYHQYEQAAEPALKAWAERIERARRESRMLDHARLIDWLLPTELEAVPPKGAPEATAIICLGNELIAATKGDHLANLRRAIDCFLSAQRIYTEGASPHQWASIQNSLGNAHARLPVGDRAENLSRAIECFQAALRVLTESRLPEEWAGTQNNLGNAYADLPTGDRAENLHRAIECYESALRLRTEHTYPAEWAATQNNLGNAYAELPTGDRAKNLSRAIDCFQAALRVRTEKTFPLDWAMTQNNLGTAFANLPTGDRSENLSRAIECYRSALRIRTESEFPQKWAATQNNLGTAYADLPRGERAENLSRAIEGYKAALCVYSQADFPLQWAATQHNLGNAYTKLSKGDQVENLNRAIECFQAALRVRTESEFPQQWATTQNNLGIAYANLPGGDRAENLKRAIACYEAALRVRSKDELPQDWASTQNNLGTAYAKLPTGDPRENAARAVACLRAALEVRTEADFPQDFAATQFNVGHILLKTHDYSAARKAYEAAARGYRAVGQEDWARKAESWRDKLTSKRQPG